MTGFAALKGALPPWSWSWDIRSVNARGLDMRIRVPDWIDGLEPAVRKAVSASVARGNVTVSLRVQRDSEEGALALNPAALERALGMLAEIDATAARNGMELAPSRAVDIAGMRGVVETAQGDDDAAPLVKALTAELPALLDAFDAMRAHEGASLRDIITTQLDQVAALVTEAEALLDARTEDQAATLKAALARVMDHTDGVDSDRVEQELALIAVKSDVREETDRLKAHVSQARSLLDGDEPRGRKLDFLMQEFNREANTLCSKAGFQPLTRIGLDLKALIDQMREQVQNIE
ncbi:MAG: YicC family protein [Maritimibacter sp.]|nr:YicC/YloC family endoribonuclease [Maritimibacter sp. UBA3975]MAM60624.1 YicC family protein [Maritimibacter sp.]|tara:strand:+ start:4067 stop:4945 length:879 start_codon:yes stop_codon:yes gene_type:complete